MYLTVREEMQKVMVNFLEGNISITDFEWEVSELYNLGSKKFELLTTEEKSKLMKLARDRTTIENRFENLADFICCYFELYAEMDPDSQILKEEIKLYNSLMV